MSSKTYALAAAVGVALLVAAAFAFATGMGPAPGGTGDDVEEFPTATASTTGDSTAVGSTTAGTGGSTTAGSTTDGGTAGSTTTTAPEPAFRTEVERIENCGRTCRDVTGRITNDGDADATGVTVYTRIFVGNGTDGDVVWEGKREIGTLEAGASVTATQRVQLSYAEALAVRGADGWITVQTTVQSDQKTVTATERRDVT